MRGTDVPTQRRPRRRQVSQGMRVGNGRTAADALGIGVGAIEILHESPGPSVADPLQNRQNKMQTQTPQPLPNRHSSLYLRHSGPEPESIPFYPSFPTRSGIHPRGGAAHAERSRSMNGVPNLANPSRPPFFPVLN